MKIIKINEIEISNNKPFTLIAGPCQIESHDHALSMASELKQICQRLKIPLIYKSSFDKANRTSLIGQRGIGMKQGLQILADVKQKLNLPIITDVHETWQVKPVAEVVDLLQIPAFLCRQTDLLLACGQTGKPINVKKGQFLAPWDMALVAEKIASTGNQQILLCERGTTHGYNDLIVDYRSLIHMAQTQYPVVFDATHSVQQPARLGHSTGGDRRWVPPLARAAVAVGVAALFMEVHDNPDCAPSDGPCMMRLEDTEQTLLQLQTIDRFVKTKTGGITTAH